MIYGCARKSPEDGRKILSETLLHVIQCVDDNCRSYKKSFIESIQFHQLKTEKHYEELANKMKENTRTRYAIPDDHYTYEEGRLIYLSIPPSAYTKTASYVNRHLRPRVGRPWFRVVLEKPFGRDSESARTLAEKMSKSFKEEEIYRIDHYLGKAIVKLILPFRYVKRKTFLSSLHMKINIKGQFTLHEIYYNTKYM